MAIRLSIDTSFLIDLQRERAGQRPIGPAHRFLDRHSEAELFLSVVALGEFAEGFPSPEDPLVVSVRDHHTLLSIDEETALSYGRTARRLREQGRLIGGNDLWIGCSSLRHGLPVVTANADDFQRVDGLEVIGYREES